MDGGEGGVGGSLGAGDMGGMSGAGTVGGKIGGNMDFLYEQANPNKDKQFRSSHALIAVYSAKQSSAS
eukprot:6191845-Pleurochrysis_carterae.AAC.1